MDTIRYYVGLLMLSVIPPAVIFWFSIHPLIRFWRKVGMRLTLGIHYAAMLLLAGLIWLLARPLLTVEFGTSPILIGLAFVTAILSLVLRRQLSRQLRCGILTGIPELSPEKHKTELLTGGIYGTIRHPRYVQFFVAATAYALFCNYLTTYLLLPALAIILSLLVQIEERELRDRYGAEYDSYCARVPRFVPRLHRPDLPARPHAAAPAIKSGTGKRP